MTQKKEIILIGLLSLLLFTVIPSKTTALYNPSFDQEVTDYFFLEFQDCNNLTSAITGFDIPNATTNWMIEVTNLEDGDPLDLDNLSGKVYEDSGEDFDLWQPTVLFPNEIMFGWYNNISGYTIDPIFESKFPVPFIVPTNMTAVNQTLNISLSAHFQYYQTQNLTGQIPAEFAGMMPSLPFLMVWAWNGTGGWVTVTEADNRTDPEGDIGDILLMAIYFDDGELNYLRESWWNNNSQRWRTRYKMVTSIWDLIGSMFEPMLAGSDVPTGGDGGMIPGFPYALVFLGLMVSIAIIYLKKPKKEILI
ncbi:MAG: hypothetical protein HWN66_21005 [Candidatus Helarchaeota archaeon]|nr:hypothetical protein [Candidatus Helarchaeota archaeon]